MHNRKATKSRDWRSPYDLLGKGLQPDGTVMKPSMEYDVHIGCLGAVRKSRDASQKPPGITAHGSHPLGGGCDGGDCRGCGRGCGRGSGAGGRG